MMHDARTAFVAWHGARIALSGAEAEDLRSRGLIHRPDPDGAPEVFHPAVGRGLDEVGTALDLLRAGSTAGIALFETAYVLAVPRGSRTLYLDEEGGFTDEPEGALGFTPEGRRLFEEDGSFNLYEGAAWRERLGERITPLPEPADVPPALPPDPAHPARGQDQVEALKRAWREDPRRDLAATPGYEAHRAELAAYQAAARGRSGTRTRREIERGSG